MEPTLPHKDNQSLARVTKILRHANVLPIGKVDPNPLIDTRIYWVE